jgi:hypothetical protein
MKNLTIYFLLIFTLLSCKEKVVDGIEIGQDLYIGQTIEENKKLSKLITQTLNKDLNALSELTGFCCGGGAGCYDLGFVFTQIVYRIGETDFIKMAEKLTEKQKGSLKGFLDVGFEYGNYENKKSEIEFPILTKILIGKADIKESVIEEPIEIYNLRKSIISKQNLDVWPSIVHIRDLKDFDNKKKDSLVLFIAETDSIDFLRISRTSNLSNYAEIEYKGNCRKEGTILTDLEIGKILSNGNEALILCRKEQYIGLKIRN